MQEHSRLPETMGQPLWPADYVPQSNRRPGPLVCRVEARRGHWKVSMSLCCVLCCAQPCALSPVCSACVLSPRAQPLRPGLCPKLCSALCAQPVCSAPMPSPCAQACVPCCAQPCLSTTSLAMRQHTCMSASSVPPTAASIAQGHPASVKLAGFIIGPCR